MPNIPNLIDKLPDYLKKGLTEAEKTVLQLAPIGKNADFRVKDSKVDDPAKAEEWGDNRTIRAEFLYWLCTDKQATKLLHAKGVLIYGSKVQGVLDFEDAHLPRSLMLAYSAIPKGIILRDATLRSISFTGSHTGPISAERFKANGVVALNSIHVKGEVCVQSAFIDDSLFSDDAFFENCGGMAFDAYRLSVGGSVFLNRIHANGETRLSRASIVGELACNSAIFENPKGIAFNADSLSVEGAAFLDKIKTKGEVRLLCASIRKQLSCTEATLENPKGIAFNADSLSVEGAAFLDKIKTKGLVRLSGACIRGDLTCIKAQIDNPKGYAFVAESLSTKGSVCLNSFKAKGQVSLMAAAIGSDFLCDDAAFDNSQAKDNTAFNANNLSAKGDMFLRRIDARGEVRLMDVAIGVNFSCEGAIFDNVGKVALNLDGLSAKGSINLSKIKAKGAVCLIGAQVDKFLACEDAKFDNREKDAFTADRLSVKGSVYLRKTTVLGVVRLLGASIGGNLECNNSKFENPQGKALIADRLSVGGNIFLHGLEAEGEVNFYGTNVTRNLDCLDATFTNEKEKGIAFNAGNMHIDHDLVFTSSTNIRGVLDLRGAYVNCMADHKNSWPKAGELYLDGFQYESFGGASTSRTLTERLEWLQLQPQEPFRSQPYEQLAKTFHRLGRESDRLRVLIAKHDGFRKHGNLDFSRRIWKWVLKRTVGYGYRPSLALVYIVCFVIVGSIIFHKANQLDIMKSTKHNIPNGLAYVESNNLHQKNLQFSPLVYSLDVFLPIVDLHQESVWLPDVTKPSNTELWGKPLGYWFRIYFWFHIVFGWVFSTLAVFSFSGLVSKKSSVSM
jgi:cytoskeletal protein CcmA (bactofilin family)